MNCMKCSLGISNFLEEISSLSHSVVFLYFFALITEEGFLVSSSYSLELHSDVHIFPFLLCFSPLFSSQLFVRPPQTAILFFFFCILFHGDGLDPFLLYNVTNLTPQFIRQSIYQIQALKSISHFHCIIIRDLIQTQIEESRENHQTIQV